MPEIFMACYCVARNKPIRCEVTKPQAVCGLRFACISWTLLWLVSTQSTFLKFSGCSRFSEFESNETATYIKHWAYTSSHRVLGRFLNRSGLHLRGVITRIKPASKQAIQVLIQICFAIVIYQWKFISIHYFEERFILRGHVIVLREISQ